METIFKPIGYIRHNKTKVPKHWTVSDLEGELVINEEYLPGIRDIKIGQRIVVLFHFHKSDTFKEEYLIQNPPHHKGERSVFSICSPLRPNPIGMSILDVLDKEDCLLKVKGIDMYDNTPVFDIKPYTEL